MPKLPIGSPLQPADYEKADVIALQALAEGIANEGQQKRALDWIIKAAGTYDLVYRPGGQEGDRDTCFAGGKAFVGQQIVKLLNYKTGQLKD